MNQPSDKTTIERQDLQATLHGPKGYSCKTMKEEQKKK